MPTPDMLKSIGDTFAAHGIVAHFDVGDIAAYRALGVNATSRLGLDRRLHVDWRPTITSCPRRWPGAGRSSRKSRALPRVLSRALACQFPGYSGTVSWKLGFQLYRDFPVRDDGTEN